VKQAAFDARILELWTKTRLPLTRANVVAVTGVPVKKAEAWLDAMVRDELLEMDSNDDGDLLWTVCSGSRLIQAGYADKATMVSDTRSLNPALTDWLTVPVGTVILLPVNNV